MGSAPRGPAPGVSDQDRAYTGQGSGGSPASWLRWIRAEIGAFGGFFAISVGGDYVGCQPIAQCYAEGYVQG